MNHYPAPLARVIPGGGRVLNEVNVLAGLKADGAIITIQTKTSEEPISGRIVWSDINNIAIEIEVGRNRVFNKAEIESWDYPAAN